MKTLSVVIPAWNEEEFIGRCLQSLIDQTVAPLEIIVVNNNSTDQTKEIAQRFEGVTVVDEPRQGRTYAVQAGCNAAKGDIIARIDADSIAPKDWAEHILLAFEEDIDALAGLYTFSETAWPFNTTFPIRFYFLLMKTLLGGRQLLVGSNSAITRQMWETVRSNLTENENLIHEDTELALLIDKIGGTVHQDDEWIIETSARRMKKSMMEYWIEYPIKQYQTVKKHRRDDTLAIKNSLKRLREDVLEYLNDLKQRNLP